MRTIGLLASLFLIACGGSGSTTDMMGDDAPPADAGTDIDPPARGFQIVTPDIDIAAGEEITYCYYFRTPNTEAMAINKWVSKMTPGSHHLIMFTTGTTDKQPPGTVSASQCGFGTGAGAASTSWTYSAQTPDSSLQLPGDDGAGKPLAIDIPPNTAGFIQMHYFNASDQAIKAHVTVNAEALPAGTAFTKTAAFITYNNSINIPPGATNDVETQTISVNAQGFPQGAKFWLMTTHAHKQAIKTEILDGANGSMVF
jgi:hypothetical protein